jgi:TetR/AcrR family transcriptional regulator
MSQPRRPAPPARRKRDALATRETLLATAERLFVEKGFDGTRIDEIAAESRVNKRMLYVYFGNKDQVYAEVLRRSFERVLALGKDVADPALGPAAQAEAAIRRYFGFVAENPSYVRLMGWESLNARSGPALAQLLSAGLEDLHAVLAKGVATGVFRADLDVRELVMSVSALCISTFSRRALLEALWGVDFARPEVRRHLLDHIVALVMRGILADPRPSSPEGDRP